MAAHPKWDHLSLLSLGESFIVDIQPEEDELDLPVTSIRAYKNVWNAAARHGGDGKKLSVRRADPSVPENKYKAVIWCTEENGKTFTPPTYTWERIPRSTPRKPRSTPLAPPQPGQPVRGPRMITSEEVQKLTYLMHEHYKNGAQIQELHDGKWVTYPNPNFMLPVSHLRIKPPPPRRLFVVHSRADKNHIVRQANTLEGLGEGYDPECLMVFIEDPDYDPNEEDQ